MKKDAPAKEYIGDNEVFADIFNRFLELQGDEKIKPQNLVSLETDVRTTYRKGSSLEIIQKQRDVFKAIAKSDSKLIYLILGIENQDEVHYAMPIKNMAYDVAEYARQIESFHHAVNAQKGGKGRPKLNSATFLSGIGKDDKLIPVITLVVYMGKTEWDGPLSLHKMFDDNRYSRLLKYVPDYGINLIKPFMMSKEELEQYESDFGDVIRFIQEAAKGEIALNQLIANNPKYENMKLSAGKFISANTNIRLTDKAKKGGTVNMCLAVQQMAESQSKEKVRKANQKARQAQEETRKAKEETRQAKEEAQQAREEAQQAKEEAQRSQGRGPTSQGRGPTSQGENARGV